jgi:glycosyltransferase involved in cell wall biosynthesis
MPVIYTDLRCLQDPRFRFRGVGTHIAGLLRQRRHSAYASFRLVGLVDDALSELPSEYAELIDELSTVTNPAVGRRGAIFIDSSPMTHNPHFTIRFTTNDTFFNVAVIYDFIPLDWPGYLPTPASRIDYWSKVARLRSFDLFCPISDYSGRRLSQIAGIASQSIVVTGAAVRQRLYEIQERRSNREQPGGRYFVTVGGGDRRKNTEAAVAAVRKLNAAAGGSFGLKVIGHYDEAYRAELLRLAGHGDGEGFLEFRAGVDDETLVELYAGAIGSICPSHIEGFSLSVVESAVCGTPVIASMCGAHLDLIRQKDALFPSRDHAGLAERLRCLVEEPERRCGLVREQAALAARFHEAEVGARFWKGIEKALGGRIGRSGANGAGKARVAFLAPYPPDQSGVARFTQLTVQAAAGTYFDVDVYTDARRPLMERGAARDGGRISSAVMLKRTYNSIISVLGNSEYHIPVFRFFEEYGGPCILHDSRLTHIYHHRLGRDGFIDFARCILGRRISHEEIDSWLKDRELPSLFIEPVLKRARPLIVHTRQYQAILRERYGVETEVTTFCPNSYFDDEELEKPCRQAARARLGIAPETFLISTFGFVSKEKGMDACIIAIDLLRGWKIPAELHFVGDTLGLGDEIRRVAGMYEVEAHVHTSTGFVDDDRYRDYMLASDAAIQLRAYGLGQPSAALVDCVSAGLACVASHELARSSDAPEYVRKVPDRVSPLQVAEQLAAIWESGQDRMLCVEARRSFLAAHSFDYYARRLAEILDLA